MTTKRRSYRTGNIDVAEKDGGVFEVSRGDKVLTTVEPTGHGDEFDFSKAVEFANMFSGGAKPATRKADPTATEPGGVPADAKP